MHTCICNAGTDCERVLPFLNKRPMVNIFAGFEGTEMRHMYHYEQLVFLLQAKAIVTGVPRASIPRLHHLLRRHHVELGNALEEKLTGLQDMATSNYLTERSGATEPRPHLLSADGTVLDVNQPGSPLCILIHQVWAAVKPECWGRCRARDFPNKPCDCWECDPNRSLCGSACRGRLCTLCRARRLLPRDCWECAPIASAGHADGTEGDSAEVLAEQHGAHAAHSSFHQPQARRGGHAPLLLMLVGYQELLVLEVISHLATMDSPESLQLCCKTMSECVQNYLASDCNPKFLTRRVAVVYPTKPMRMYTVHVHMHPDSRYLADRFHRRRLDSIAFICYKVLSNAYGPAFGHERSSVRLGNWLHPRVRTGDVPANPGRWTPREWDASSDGCASRHLGWLMGRNYGNREPERPSVALSVGKDSIVATAYLDRVWLQENLENNVPVPFHPLVFPVNRPVQAMYPRRKQEKRGFVVLLKLHNTPLLPSMLEYGDPELAPRWLCLQDWTDDDTEDCVRNLRLGN